MPLAPGQRIAAYEILAPLGAGGMGEVWRARDTRLGREVAIKVLPEAFVRDPERLGRFEREARTLAALNHPNVAAIYGLEDAYGAPHLVLELVEGESLAQRLARGPLSVRETLETCAQIAAAVEAAHERGIVHRDLKPANVMLNASRTVKVLDFGLAKDTEAGDSSATVASPPTAAGMVLGTMSYMSPEQARGLAVDRRTDVWALGCILYECLTGRPAFGGPTSSDILSRVLEREPEWNLLGPGVPQRLREVLRRCLVKEAEARPKDIGDVRIELMAIERELSSGPRPAAPASAGPSLAVLYFDNLAKDPESEYFCGGIAEDILTDLSKVGGLRVTSKNAVARYRGKEVDPAQVGTDLAVTAVLEGSVRRAGDRVRITAQLVNAADGFHLWAERYDRTLDVFSVQEEIASAIASALKVALTPQDVRRMAHNKPNDARAYDLYLKGRERYDRYDAEGNREALALFEEAIALDPQYALAWAGKADVHAQELQWGRGDAQRDGTAGLAAAERALAIDPRLPEAYKAKALVLENLGDVEGSRRELENGLKVDPRNLPVLINLATDRYARGDIAGAERCLRRGIEVDPHQGFAILWLAGVCNDTGRHHEAIALAMRARRLNDQQFYLTAATMVRTTAHLARGEVDEAASVVAEGKAAGAEPASIRAMAAMIAAARGDVEFVRAELPAISKEPTGFTVSLYVADLAARLGDLETASRIMQWPINRGFNVTLRLFPGLRLLTELPQFGPPRADVTLVWPLEAPMIDSARFKLFREVKLESGIPDREGPV